MVEIFILFIAYFLKSYFNILDGLLDALKFIPTDKKDDIYLLIYVAILNLILKFIGKLKNKIVEENILNIEIISFNERDSISINNNPTILINRDFIGEINLKVVIFGKLRETKIVFKFPNWIEVQSSYFKKLNDEFYEMDIYQLIGRRKGILERIERDIKVLFILCEDFHGEMQITPEIENEKKWGMRNYNFKKNTFIIKHCRKE